MDFQDFGKMASYKGYTLRFFHVREKLYIFGERNSGILTNLPYLYYDEYPKELFYELEKEGYKKYQFFTCHTGVNIQDSISRFYIAHNYSNNFVFSSSTKKTYKKSLSSPFLSSFSTLSLDNINSFFKLYTDFFQGKELEFLPYLHFEWMAKVFQERLSIMEVYIEKQIIGSVLLLQYDRKILLMFGGYDRSYIKCGLKYYINIDIIEYFRNNGEIEEIVFGSGNIVDDSQDSLFLFKKKFGDVYSLTTNICL